MLELAPKLVEVLDVVAAVEDAALAEQPRPEHAPLVEQVGHRVGVFGQRCGEEHALVQLAHAPQEVVHVRPLQHIYLVHGAVDLHRHYEVRVADGL